MIYRLYTNNDTFLASEPNISGQYRDAGRDPILEISQYPDSNNVTRYKNTLIEFDTGEINNTITLAGSIDFSASLNLYVAEAAELPVSFSVSAQAVSESWTAGNSLFTDEPIRNTGATWIEKRPGLDWATAGATVHAAYYASSSYINTDDFDININVTEIVNAISSSTIDNNGFKLDIEKSGDVLTSTSQSISLKYFGCNSHTIFKPFLQFEWDDSSFDTGSANVITSSPFKVFTKNLKDNYKNKDKNRFRVSSRPIFPTAAFVTSSIKTDYVLPEETYFSVRDTYTNEAIIDYSIGTKVSCDSNGSYFDLYMNSLRTERFYYFEFKTKVDTSTVYFRDDKSFKVVK